MSGFNVKFSIPGTMTSNNICQLEKTFWEHLFTTDFTGIFGLWIIELNLNGYCLNCSESQSSGPGLTILS